MKYPEVSSHGKNIGLYRIAGIIKRHSTILRRKLEIKRASHIQCSHLATLRFIGNSLEMLLKVAVKIMSDIRGYIWYILYYMYIVYIVYICCKQCHWKVGVWQWGACLPGSLLKHNTTPQNPLIELHFFCVVSESLLRLGPAQSARSVSSTLVEAFHISLSLFLSFSLSTSLVPCFFWATLPWCAKKFRKEEVKTWHNFKLWHKQNRNKAPLFTFNSLMPSFGVFLFHPLLAVALLTPLNLSMAARNLFTVLGFGFSISRKLLIFETICRRQTHAVTHTCTLTPTHIRTPLWHTHICTRWLYTRLHFAARFMHSFHRADNMTYD